MIKQLKEIPPQTLITGLAAIAWLASFGLRAVFPDFKLGPAADTLMATVVAWWMKSRRAANGGQDDLLTEVVSKVAMPMISTAHAEPAPTAPRPAAAPTAAPPPAAPKPSTPPKPGGLPWGT